MQDKKVYKFRATHKRKSKRMTRQNNNLIQQNNQILAQGPTDNQYSQLIIGSMNNYIFPCKIFKEIQFLVSIDFNNRNAIANRSIQTFIAENNLVIFYPNEIYNEHRNQKNKKCDKNLSESKTYFQQKKYLETIVALIRYNQENRLNPEALKLEKQAIQHFNANLFFQLYEFAKQNNLRLEQEQEQIKQFRALFVKISEIKVFNQILIEQILSKNLQLLFPGKHINNLEISLIFCQYIDLEWTDEIILINYIKIANHLLSLIKWINKYCNQHDLQYENDKFNNILKLGMQYSEICIEFEITRQNGIMLVAEVNILVIKFNYCQKKYSEALKYLENNLNPNSATQLHFIAKCHQKLNHNRQANRYLEQAFNINPFSLPNIKFNDLFSIWGNNDQLKVRRKKGDGTVNKQQDIQQNQEELKNKQKNQDLVQVLVDDSQCDEYCIEI